MSTLFLVATPIGNLEDITLRALRILREATLIAAEDTRTTGVLLAHYGITTPLISFHDFSDAGRIAQLVERLASGPVALVTDAGTPGISDPGYELVRAAVAAGHTVSPIPGPNAAVAALAAGGLPSERFLFLGFLPRREQARREALAAVADLPVTLVLYEAPHRLLKLLETARAVLGNRPICVAREVTKYYEEFWRGTLDEALPHFGSGPVRGEVTVVVGGAAPAAAVWSAEQVQAALDALLAQGVSHKEAAARVAGQAGWRKREVYRLLL